MLLCGKFSLYLWRHYEDLNDVTTRYNANVYLMNFYILFAQGLYSSTQVTYLWGIHDKEGVQMDISKIFHQFAAI